MAQPFLKLVSDYIYTHYKDNVEKLCIVLPNKRGALFLKNHLAQTFSKTIWLPTIISAEDLVKELSGLQPLEEIDLLCYLYESYKQCYGSDAEPFDSFVKWGQLILQDFNEIDRYLANSVQLYENLKDIKTIENWSLGEEQLSEYQTNYLKFMNSLGSIYKHFSSFLISQGWAYQGLSYKHAVLNLEKSTFTHSFDKLIFCGFNALNAAELKILNYYHLQKKADLLWDADEYYLNSDNQEAGLFLRTNLELFKQKDYSFIGTHFKTEKEITIVSAPKQIGQAQVVKQTLQKLIDANIPLDKVAVVLANEKLLWPVLQQLPESIEHVNITMEYPLKYTSAYSFIDTLITIQISFSKQNLKHKTIYHKDLIGLLRQPIFRTYVKAKGIELESNSIIQHIIKRNISFLSEKNLRELFEVDFDFISPLLQPVNSITLFCELLFDVLQSCIDFFSQNSSNNKSSLELEYLHILLKNFNRLNEVLKTYPHFNDLHSFKQLYIQVVGNSSAPFIGEPLRGLQIMGVLETRTLDFDYLIFVNVNEGVLPSGKTINSFIPNDLKRAFGLPLYLEKDAIYAYHFYRLLQRASDITITFDSETDSFGKGEKSRFVTQLQLELANYNSEIIIREEVAFAPNFEEELDNAIVVQKNNETLKSILMKASNIDTYSGLSPSSLISFKECSLKFYFRYGAHLKETEDVEENAEANTFGSILHLSLEKLYTNFTNTVLQKEKLNLLFTKIDSAVNESFISFFDNKAPVGKSLLQEEVLNVYVKKLLNNDLKFVEQLKLENKFLTLNKLEEEFSSSIEISIRNKKTTVYLKGKIDRIDSYGGQVRVIDYKSSIKQTDKFVFEGFEKLFSDTNYNKQLQLIIYAWLLYKNNFCEPEKIQPCIIPFKVFSEEPKYILENKKPLVLSQQFLNDFERELKLFIGSLFDETIPFSQTNDRAICEYCAYRIICNIN